MVKSLKFAVLRRQLQTDLGSTGHFSSLFGKYNDPQEREWCLALCEILETHTVRQSSDRPVKESVKPEWNLNHPFFDNFTMPSCPKTDCKQAARPHIVSSGSVHSLLYMWFYHSKLRFIKEDADFPFFFVIFVFTWEISVYKNLFCVKKQLKNLDETKLYNNHHLRGYAECTR